MKSAEDQLATYATPIRDTEESKCKNAIAVIRDVLKEAGVTASNESIKSLLKDTYSYVKAVNFSADSVIRNIKNWVRGSCVRSYRVGG